MVKKNAYTIFHMLTSLIVLQQGNVNKKMTKIINIEEKIFLSAERLEEVQ